MRAPINTITPNILERAESPFHEGERAMHARLGIDSKMELVGRRVIRDHMPDQHREFFTQLPFIVAATVDANQQPWETLVCKPPGFIHSPDPRHLHINTLPDQCDPLHALLTTGASVGLLGIQFHTRRRNRMNGRVVQHDEHGILVEVQQSFGNCPKYIQARECVYSHAQQLSAPEVIKQIGLDSIARDIIQRADTFFIATSSQDLIAPQGGVDASHRGGKPGFVKIDGNTLYVPDYLGNFMFNTLGNIQVNPKTGLLFIDFESGHLLHLTARAEIIWDESEVQKYPGAQRLLVLHIDKAVLVKRRVPLRWSGWELSPHLADKQQSFASAD
jgi:uncharacterized protein